MGVVPVEPDGSAYFEVPSGRAVYFQALDTDGRMIQSMRTFVQAAPGTTRSCIGCHKYKYGAAPDTRRFPVPPGAEPRRLQAESWGSGFVDYPSMVQPVLDRHCVECHKGYIPKLSRTERDLIMAWIDSNGLYHGSWDYTKVGCAIPSWGQTKHSLMAQMKVAGCARCHAGPGGTIARFEDDWINLQTPEQSRILRAPLAKGADGFGLGLCRQRPVDPRPRVRLLVNGYAHAVQPIAAFAPRDVPQPDSSGPPAVSFASTADPHYQAMLATLRQGRTAALASPRVDMPGADVQPGECRQFLPPPLPMVAPPLTASIGEGGEVVLSWERSARTIGLETEIHRSGTANFEPSDKTLLTRTTLFAYRDTKAMPGRQHYAILMASIDGLSRPAHAAIDVPAPKADATGAKPGQ